MAGPSCALGWWPHTHMGGSRGPLLWTQRAFGRIQTTTWFAAYGHLYGPWEPLGPIGWPQHDTFVAPFGWACRATCLEPKATWLSPGLLENWPPDLFCLLSSRTCNLRSHEIVTSWHFEPLTFYSLTASPIGHQQFSARRISLKFLVEKCFQRNDFATIKNFRLKFPKEIMERFEKKCDFQMIFHERNIFL